MTHTRKPTNKRKKSNVIVFQSYGNFETSSNKFIAWSEIKQMWIAENSIEENTRIFHSTITDLSVKPGARVIYMYVVHVYRSAY